LENFWFSERGLTREAANTSETLRDVKMVMEGNHHSRYREGQVQRGNDQTDQAHNGERADLKANP